jgi:hypothetical protein
MPPTATVVARLTANPKPVICLDTCDILEVVQCLDWEKPGIPRSVNCIEPVRRLLKTLAVDPDRAMVVITDLVHTEWNQNIASVRQKADEYLKKIDSVVSYPYQAAGFAGTALPGYDRLSSKTLVDDLVALSTALLNQATRLDLESALNTLALGRVMTKRRPSHDGHIKDSMNFEHYLAFARQLRAAGFVKDVLFVSKNRKDYWDGDKDRIHPDLKPEIEDPAIQLQFFGSLAWALGRVGI